MLRGRDRKIAAGGRKSGARFAPERGRPQSGSHLTIGESGYILAKMPFEIVLAPEAVEDFKSMRANVRAEIRVALETHLRHEPERVSRSRIKRLRALRQPQYRLRVGEVRVFYDVIGATVQVLAIVDKKDAKSWLEQFGNPE